MSPQTPPVTAVHRLAEHLLGTVDDHVLTHELGTWLAGSPRFRAFADAHKDKIRKKLRGATDADARRDVRAELRAAYELLVNRGSSSRSRRTGRESRAPTSLSPSAERAPSTSEVRGYAGHRTCTRSSGRSSPSSANLHPASRTRFIAIEGSGAAGQDLVAATQALRARADGKDEAFFAARGFDGTKGFYDRYLRLGAVFVWSEAESGDDRAATWINKSARIPLPDRAVRACLACFCPGE